MAHMYSIILFSFCHVAVALVNTCLQIESLDGVFTD